MVSVRYEGDTVMAQMHTKYLTRHAEKKLDDQMASEVSIEANLGSVRSLSSPPTLETGNRERPIYQKPPAIESYEAGVN